MLSSVLPLDAVQAWVADPVWQGMEPAAQGFHTQLMLMAAQRSPLGSLPDDDALWRRWLRLPPAWTAPRSVSKNPTPHWATGMSPVGVHGQGISSALLDVLQTAWNNESVPHEARASFESWVDYLWVHRWKPMILAAWQRIDAGLVALQPSLQGHEGGWWNATAAALGRSSRLVAESATMPSTPGGLSVSPPPSGGRKAKPKVRTTPLAPTGSPLVPGVVMFGDVGQDGIVWLNGDTGAWRNLTKVLRTWRPPVTTARRQIMWDVGVSFLSPDHGGQQHARAFLGKLIKQHGEQKVAAAIANLTTRADAPVDAYSFLSKMLDDSELGTPAEQRARAQRAHVAL